MKRYRRLYRFIAMTLCFLLLSGNNFYPSDASPSLNDGITPTLIPRYTALLAKAKQEGTVQVIAEFSVPFRSVWAFFGDSVEQSMMQSVRRQIVDELSTYKTKVYSDDDLSIPFIWLELNEPALRHLMANPLITDIAENVGIPMEGSIHVTATPTP